jgi:hypothetical protein
VPGEIEFVWTELTKMVNSVQRKADEMKVRYERAEQAGGVQPRLVAEANAQLATGAVGAGDLLFLEDACNPDVESGVGALCWADPISLQWRRVYDNAIATSCVGNYLTDDDGNALLDDSGALLTE